jgi:nuclear pore complex protein Nup155
MVQWCIVLTTPEEVLLLALVDQSSSSNYNSQEATAASSGSSASSLQLVETSFNMSSDMLQFTAVTGTNSGRIFLGANDGSLHEMIYEDHGSGSSANKQQQQQTGTASSSFVEQQLNKFYNGNKSLPAVLYPTAHDANATGGGGGALSSVLSMGKRTLQAISGIENNNDYDDDRRYGSGGHQGPRKCRKLNRTLQPSNSSQGGGASITTALVPDVLQHAASFLLGRPAATAGGGIVSLQMDEERQCLYSLTRRGWIATFDVSRPDAAPLASLANVPQVVRMYLETVARGQVVPPSSSSWSIRFPGGTMAASAGVGGMQGAREILKLADGVGRGGARNTAGTAGSSVRPSSSSSAAALPHPILTPIALHVIPRRESSRLTLMAVTSGGLRLYLSSLHPNTLGSNVSSGTNGIVGMQYSMRGSTTTNPWGPSNQLTLCHIRAPPPVSSIPSNDMPLSTSTFTSNNGGRSPSFATFNNGANNNNDGYAAINTVDSGIKPHVVSALNQTTQQVDASFYDAGHWVAAVQDQTNNKGSDLVLSVAPDSMARIAEPDEIITSHNNNRNDRTQLMAPGGLAETLSLPISSAYGGGSSADDTNKLSNTNNMTAPVLLGGLVWEIASMQDMNEDDSTRQRRQQVLSLTLNSQTPSDADLDVGLPPAFCPPSKSRTRQNGRSVQGGGVDRTISSSRVLTVPRYSPWQIFLNALSSRPVNYGLSLPRPVAEPFVEQDYRISKCTGVDGFSLTAAEMGRPAPPPATTATAASAGNAPLVVVKSARLRPSLLRPPVVPLNQFATHHLTSAKRQIVALNVQGLHYFEFNTILSSLADALIAAGDNTESDATVTSFFTGYGYKEGCSMCLALAIGAGPASGDAVYNHQLRRGALKAALTRALSPKLVVLSDYQNPTISSSETTTDPFIPRGFTFCPSALSDGLTMLFSRLARPVWNKPYVVVTEGRDIKLAWSGGIKTAPAKVEILLDEETLEEIRGPLRSLLKLAKDNFAPAVRSVPGTMKRQDMSMDIDMVANQSQYLTQAMQHHSHRRAGTGVGAATVLTARDAEAIARLAEERNIHSLYRLMARAVQFLNLVSLLQKAENMVELPHVNWGLLHGLTIAQLVQNPEGQDRLEALLNSLVVSPASASANAARSAQAKNLARQFAEDCYLYFPPASQFAHEGLRLAGEALAIPAPSSQRDRLAFEAASNLCKAARHWHSPPLITGSSIRSNVKESYEQIARRALQHESPLATATDVLIKLGNVAGAVDICLTTAANFKSVNAAALEKVQIQGALAWEHDLYHKNREGVVNGNGPISSGYATTVTAQDAIDTCHALVFHYLSSLLSLNKEWALRMLSACIAAPDTTFLADLFSHLLERSETDTLLMIDSPHLDAWLLKRNDVGLLFSYYTTQKRHVDAARVMFDWACSKSIKLSLGDRIAALSKALNSYRVAANDRTLHNQRISNEDVVTKTFEVQDTLHLAKLQFRTLDAIRSKPELGRLLDAESHEKLGFTLVPASDLYNEFAAKLSLYGICLVILHTCRYDDTTNIFTLWKNCVCEELVPCATRSQQLYEFLQDFVQDVDLGNGIKLLSAASSEQSEFQIFEDGRWILRLEDKVVNLGKELFGTGADYTFPIDYLLFLLESLRQSNPAAFRTTAWSLMTLVDAGVPYLVVLSAFERFSQQDGRVFVGGGDDHSTEDTLVASVELLEYWLGKCRSPVGGFGEQTNAAPHVELSRAIVTGEVMQTIYALRSKLDLLTAPAFTILRDRLTSVEEAVQTY